MGVTTEQWRISVGLWIGGNIPGKVRLQDNFTAYFKTVRGNSTCKQCKNGTQGMRFFLLLTVAVLLIRGCVEMNPGPKKVT
jgi:hypothetical protein